MSSSIKSQQALQLCLAVSSFLVTACGAMTPQSSELKSSGDVVTIAMTPENRPNVVNLLQKMKASRDSGGALMVSDLISIVPLSAADASSIATAFPTQLSVDCAADGICNATGAGTATRVHTIATTPDLVGVDLGVRSSLKSSFRIQEDGVKAIVCEVEGVYFSKLIVRKNLKAFSMDLSGEGETKVWLAGAEEIPGC